MQAAEEVWLETLPIRMCQEGFDAFLAALAAPSSVASKMVDLLQRTAPWERNL